MVKNSVRWILIHAVLVLFGINIQAGAVLLDRLTAMVNSDIILQSDVVRFRVSLNLRRQLDPLFANSALAAKISTAKERDIVDFLVDERLILSEFEIPDDQVEAEIRNIQRNNRIDRPTLIAALKQEGFDFDDYFELIRSSLAKRSLIDRDIRTKVNVTEDDIKNYYLSNFASGERSVFRYHIRIITMTPDGYDSSASLKKDAFDCYRSVKSGSNFAIAAEKYSDHPSQDSGGDLGTLRSDELSPEIKRAIQKLKIGAVSPLLGSDKEGYMILKLEDIQSDSLGGVERKKNEILEALTAKEYRIQIDLWLDQKRSQSFVKTVYE